MLAGICNIGISRCRPMPFGALSDHQKMEKGICMCNKIRYFVES